MRMIVTMIYVFLILSVSLHIGIDFTLYVFPFLVCLDILWSSID